MWKRLLRWLRGPAPPLAVPPVAPDPPAPQEVRTIDQMLLALQQYGEPHQRLDAPGLLSDCAVYGAQTRFGIVYRCFNRVLVRRGERLWACAPADAPRQLALLDILDGVAGPEDVPRRRVVTALPARSWADDATDAERAAWCAAVGHHLRLSEPVDPPPRERADDLAPLLHPDLLRRCEAGDLEGLGHLVALLDRLVAYRGEGADELKRPHVHLRPADIARLLDGLGDHEWQAPDWERMEDAAVLRDLRREAAAGCLIRDGARHRLLALTELAQRTVGTTGSTYTVAALRLEVDAAGWRLERHVLYEHRYDGIEVS